MSDDAPTPQLADRDEAITNLQTLLRYAYENNHAAYVERDAIKAELAEARAEIALDDARLADLDRILDAIPCPTHGRCITHALDQIEVWKNRK